MQAVIVLPAHAEVEFKNGANQLLFREVCGIPLLVRTIMTAVRAGTNHFLLLYSGAFPSHVEKTLRENNLLKRSATLEFVRAPEFDPSLPARWAGMIGRLDQTFLWLPWNWVTNKHALLNLDVLEYNPPKWTSAARLEREAMLLPSYPDLDPVEDAPGVAILAPASVQTAERWLVANSGKPLDGIYTTFNRRLCRPFVRMLTHTAATPNAVTVAGLLVAIAAAYFFATGTYLSSVIGALLFFASGLLDEVDGMLARLKFSDSAFGTWFEGSVDNVSYLLLFAGISIGLCRQRGPRELWIGGAVVVGAILSTAVISWQRKRSTHSDRPNEYLGNMYRLLEQDRASWMSRTTRRIQFFLKKGVFVHYVVIFTVLGLLPVLMWIAAFAGNLTWIVALYFSRRFFRRSQMAVATAQLPDVAKVNL